MQPLYIDIDFNNKYHICKQKKKFQKESQIMYSLYVRCGNTIIFVNYVKYHKNYIHNYEDHPLIIN